MNPVKIGSMVWVVEEDDRGVVRGQVIPARRLRGGLYLVRSSRDKSLMIRHFTYLHATKAEAIAEMKASMLETIQQLQEAFPEKVEQLKQRLNELNEPKKLK